MKAIRVTQFGGPEVLVLEDVPMPTPGLGQVRVKLEAAGINPVDTYIRTGTYARLPQVPYTPGTDGAGVVDAVADDVANTAVGERVYVAALIGRSCTGTYAEHVVCDAESVHPLPVTMTAGQGAAVGVPYATAWRALFQKAHVQPGETVFVHGASGGVGLAAVQIARAHGAQVIGSASTADGLELIRSEGAHIALNHASEVYLDELLRLTGGRGADVILEMLANVNLERDLTIAARDGRIVVIGSRGSLEFTPRLTMARELTIMGMAYWNTPPDDDRRVNAAIAAGLESGTLRPAVGRQFALGDAARAHEAVMVRGAHGKIVLLP